MLKGSNSRWKPGSTERHWKWADLQCYFSLDLFTVYVTVKNKIITIIQCEISVRGNNVIIRA